MAGLGNACRKTQFTLLPQFIPRRFQALIKEQCHEDFAVLAQFCVKIITLRL